MRVRVQYADGRGRRCAVINVPGREEKADMANNDRRRDGPQPWNLYRIVKVEKEKNGRVETKEEWVQCGIAWPMKEREGYTFDLHFTIPEGSKLAILPRQNGNDR